MIRIFVDTSIVRSSETIRNKWSKTKKTINWGGKDFEIEADETQTSNPIDRLAKPEHEKIWKNAKRLPKVLKLARKGLIQLYWDFETEWEYIRNKSVAKRPYPPIINLIQKANSPILYGRTIAAAFSEEDHQFEFLRNLKHPEYDKWKKCVGAVEGSKKERNQLMDAWHLWVADHNHCEYFLTVDYNIIKSVESRPPDTTLRVVDPQHLLEELRMLSWAMIFERRAWQRIFKLTSP